MRPSLRWSTLPAGLAAGLVLILAFALVLVPQLTAVAITNLARFNELPRLTIFDAFRLWVTNDPTTVTHAETSGALHHVIAWAVLLVVAATVILIVFIALQRAKDPQRKHGLATLFDVQKQLGTKQLMHERGPKLRPALARSVARPEDYGYRVGAFWKEDVWVRVEDPTVMIGPSRAGKGWFLVLNWILSAPGAVITTSSKMDNAILTMKERQRRHPESRVWVFAPGIAGGENLGHVLRWNPVAGCVDEETLVRRIHALIPKDAFSGSTSNGGHWDTLGQQLSAALFHAAACSDATVDKIWEWVSSPQRALEAVRAIREHPDGLLEHAAYLEQVINMPGEQRATQWAVLPTSLAFLASRSARKSMKPEPGSEMNPVDFVLNKGTLYLVGDKQTTGGYTRIIDGLLAELDYVSKGLADASPGARLDPPITYLLDEAGNFEYQGLYELITAGGGRGRVGVAVFQAKEQLAQWGQSEAKTMWDAAVAKIILPGGADEAELRGMSQLVGELWVKREQHTWGVGPGSVSVGEEKRAVLEANEIREMEAGYALLFYRNLKPVIPKMRGFDENPAYGRCQIDAERLAVQMRERSPFAAAALSKPVETE